LRCCSVTGRLWSPIASSQTDRGPLSPVWWVAPERHHIIRRRAGHPNAPGLDVPTAAMAADQAPAAKQRLSDPPLMAAAHALAMGNEMTLRRDARIHGRHAATDAASRPSSAGDVNALDTQVPVPSAVSDGRAPLRDASQTGNTYRSAVAVEGRWLRAAGAKESQNMHWQCAS
jgi:hypothetical protein